jgi:hypothetical protein
MEEIKLSFPKRITLISALAAMILAVIAMGLVNKWPVTRVHAARSTPAFVVIRCDAAPNYFAGDYDGVLSISSSDQSVSLPTAIAGSQAGATAPGTSCAAALSMLYQQGFTVQNFSIPGNSPGEFDWVLIRY